jgi:8-oxo-dGTP diphosphatase
MDPTDFPAADRTIITALRLPDLCLITGDDPRDPGAFLDRLSRTLEGGIRLVQLRAHALDDAAYARLAKAAYALCERHGAQLLLNRDPAQAADLPGHGLHLTATRLAALSERPIDAARLAGASCHCADDLARTAALGLDYALLSPIQATASHPGAEPLGWAGFAALADRAALPVYALGGLTRADLDTAIAHGAQGIAAIRGLWPERP